MMYSVGIVFQKYKTSKKVQMLSVSDMNLFLFKKNIQSAGKNIS